MDESYDKAVPSNDTFCARGEILSEYCQQNLITNTVFRFI